jgi:hypothetical protein
MKLSEKLKELLLEVENLESQVAPQEEPFLAAGQWFEHYKDGEKYQLVFFAGALEQYSLVSPDNCNSYTGKLHNSISGAFGSGRHNFTRIYEPFTVTPK